ncbi:MAG: hypothetical protein KDC35_13825 [Acidobacteria bacterium]|nr:hypothetical protein [Acidobacteriota bacterium]
MVRITAFTLCVVASWWCVAQTTFQEQAARLQNINAYLLDFRPAAAPEVREKISLEFVLDLAVQPSVDTRVGNKDEDIDPPGVVPKLRGRLHFQQGFMIGGAFAPGIEFQGYEADFVAAELGWRKQMNDFTIGVRGSWIDGEILGPVTEPELDDLFVFENYAGDVSLAWSWTPTWTVYGFAGFVTTETSLDVALDGVHLDNDDDAFYGGAGVQWRNKKWRAVLEQNFTASYLNNVIASLSYSF